MLQRFRARQAWGRMLAILPREQVNELFIELVGHGMANSRAFITAMPDKQALHTTANILTDMHIKDPDATLRRFDTFLERNKL